MYASQDDVMDKMDMRTPTIGVAAHLSHDQHAGRTVAMFRDKFLAKPCSYSSGGLLVG